MAEVLGGPEVRMSSYAWLQRPEYDGLEVLDPDGWDRKNLEASMTEEITHAEFTRRIMVSTIQVTRRESPAGRTLLEVLARGFTP